MADERERGGGDIEDRLRAGRQVRSRDEQRERLQSGAAWDDFCDALRSAGHSLLTDDNADTEQQRADGHRYLLGLAISGIQQAVSLSDPLVPAFIRNPDSTSKWGAENADNQYLWTRISPSDRYRIEGTRGSAYEILFEVKEGYMQLGDAKNFATLDASQLHVDANGRFEVELGGEAPSRSDANWLPIHAEARYLAIRVYFTDWSEEQPPEFRIVREGGEGVPARATDAASMSDLLDGAGEWIRSSALVWNEWTQRLKSAHVPGTLAPARSYVGGADDIFYGNDWFRLAPDEAMILESELPDARYWSFQLGSVWFHSLDFTTRQTSLNHRQAQIDADGRLRIVIAHDDPGIHNWLDTAGNPEGLLQYRWIWTRSNPQPSVRIVKQSELASALPADTPRIDAVGRRAQLAARQRHVWRRERWS